MADSKMLSIEQSQSLFRTLEGRFEKNRSRHEEIEWQQVRSKLEANPEKLWPLMRMEETEGEPDVIGYDETTDTYIFCDCSLESPKGRRSLCYDLEAWEGRKEHKPKGNAIDLAEEMGIEMLSEAEYRALQTIENFDLKTSSWVATPKDIREKGGALFCDYRFGHVFMYHNGAESYYAARGFRGLVRV